MTSAGISFLVFFVCLAVASSYTHTALTTEDNAEHAKSIALVFFFAVLAVYFGAYAIALKIADYVLSGGA